MPVMLQQLKSPHNTAMSRMSYQGSAGGSSSSIIGGGMKPQESQVSPLQQALLQPSPGVDDQLQSPPYPQGQQSFMSAASDKIGGNSHSFQQQPMNQSYIGNTGMWVVQKVLNS